MDYQKQLFSYVSYVVKRQLCNCITFVRRELSEYNSKI